MSNADSTISRMESIRSRIDYQGIILGVICCVVTLLLLIGEKLTSAPIQQQLEKDKLAVLAQVLPHSYYDNSPLQDTVMIEDGAMSDSPVELYMAKKNGALTAIVYQIETQGYGGTITLMIALNTDGEILGLRTLTHKETPGLADKIEIDKSDWITNFNGKSLNNLALNHWAVKKDGGDFDQFTGATITPRAVVRGVLSGLNFYSRHATNLGSTNLNPEKTEELVK